MKKWIQNLFIRFARSYGITSDGSRASAGDYFVSYLMIVIPVAIVVLVMEM